MASNKFKNVFDQSKKSISRESTCVKECIEKLINLEKLIDFEVPHLDNSIHVLKQSIYKSSIEKLSNLYEIQSVQNMIHQNQSPGIKIVEKASRKSPSQILQGEIEEWLLYIEMILKCSGYEWALEEAEEGLRNYESSLNPMAHAYAKDI